MLEHSDRRLIPWWPDTGAALGGVSKSTVYRLVRSGDLPSVKIGRRRFVALRDIDEYIDRCREDMGTGGEAA